MLVHFSILATILILGFIYDEKIKVEKIGAALEGNSISNVKSPVLPWFLLFSLITFYACIRTYVNDTAVYVFSFNNLNPSWDNVSEILSGDSKDKGFYILQNIFKMYVSTDYHMWFLFISILESILLLYVFKAETVSFLDASFFFFSSTLYFNYFSMMRQWLAICITFAGYSFIKEKRFIPYLLICIIAAQFHNSAYFMIFIYFLVQDKPWKRKQNVLLLLAFISLIFFQPLLNYLDSSAQGTTYEYVFSTMKEGAGSSIVRPFIYLVPVALSYLHRNEIYDDFINKCVNISVLSFLLSILATFTSGLFVNRFMTYLNLYNVILFPYLLNVSYRDNKNVRVLFYIFYFIFYLYQMYYGDSFNFSSDLFTIFNYWE